MPRNDLNATQLAEQRGVIWKTPAEVFEEKLNAEIRRRTRALKTSADDLAKTFEPKIVTAEKQAA
jgi:hypothetical protein